MDIVYIEYSFATNIGPLQVTTIYVKAYLLEGKQPREGYAIYWLPISEVFLP